jgi:hypothetical protein
MPKITISYRRADSQDITGRIFDRLVARFGRDSVFRDIDNIRPGLDFREQIEQTLQRSDVLLAIVGPKWLGRAKSADPRIENEADLVRIEIATALKRNIPVIPVLVGGTKMPTTRHLPEEIKEFAFRHAVTIGSGRDFDHHVDGLINALNDLSSGGESATVSDRRRWTAPRWALWIGLAGAGAAVGALGLWFAPHIGSHAPAVKELPQASAPPPSPTRSFSTAQPPPTAETAPAPEATPRKEAANPAITLGERTKKINPITGMPFTLGDSYAEFKAFYKSAPFPSSTRRSSSRRDQSSTVDLKEINVSFYFDGEQKLYRMWFGPRFTGDVYGIKIGDKRDLVIQSLGAPTRMRGSPRRPSNLAYDKPDTVSVAFQFGGIGDSVNGFWLFDDSIQPLGGFVPYAPPPPPEPMRVDRAEALARVARVDPPLPITFGDSYAMIKDAYKIDQEPAPYQRGGKVLRLNDLGIWFFFNDFDQITVIRLEAPFRGSVSGVHIGDERDQVKKVLGAPDQNGSSDTFFYGRLQIRFDFDGKVEAMFL